MAATEGLESRLKLLIKKAPSQAKLAKLGGIADGSLINWKRGAGYRESDLRNFAANIDVSPEWLIDGIGDEEVEVEKMKQRFAGSSPRDRLAAALARHGFSTAQLAKRMGYNAAIIERLVNGNGRASEKMIDAIVAVLPELSKEDLMGGSDAPSIISETEATFGAKPKLITPPGIRVSSVPLLSKGEAGTWSPEHSDAAYEHTSVVALNVDDRRAFAIRVSGDSMEPDLRDGDVVICSPAKPLENGAAAVVRTRSENVYIKFWRKKGNRVQLLSANPDHKALDFPLEEIVGAWPIVQTISSRKIVTSL